MDPIEELKNHTKNLPCFSCIIRVFCSKLTENGHIEVKQNCGRWDEWSMKKDNLVFGNFMRLQWRKIVSSSIAEVLELEKKRFQ